MKHLRLSLLYKTTSRLVRAAQSVRRPSASSVFYNPASFLFLLQLLPPPPPLLLVLLVLFVGSSPSAVSSGLITFHLGAPFLFFHFPRLLLRFHNILLIAIFVLATCAGLVQGVAMQTSEMESHHSNAEVITAKRVSVLVQEESSSETSRRLITSSTNGCHPDRAPFDALEIFKQTVSCFPLTYWS